MSTDTNEQNDDHVNNNEENSKGVEDGESKEAQLERVPYPKSVFFIISNEFCERFSYYGMRTILSLYLRDILLFSESDSTVIYHVFTMFAYFFPIIGAIISDSWLGKFKTILYVSIIYASGNILLALSSAGPLHIPQVPFSLLALFLIAVGTGGIKPCVAAFGGDQFVLPQQELQLAAFFSVFYFSINAGSLISTFLTPVLREDVQCFGEDSCFPLAFAIPGILMIISVLIFFFGMPLYKIREPEGNVCVEVVKCIWHAMRQKFKSSKSDKQVEHWLDRAEDKFDRSLINDIKDLLKVLVVFVPLPIFWACYDQQGSKWTFQAARMNGKVGSFTILPDQMQVINPLLILAFIPLFTYIVYPFLTKMGILKTPLQRMVCGGCLTAVAFGISACISLALETNDPVLPSDGNCQLRIYNPYNADLSLNVKELKIETTVGKFGYSYLNIDMTGEHTVNYDVTVGNFSTSNSTILSEGKGYVFYPVKKTSKVEFFKLSDDIDKPSDGVPKVRTLVFNPSSDVFVTYMDGSSVELNISSTKNDYQSIDPGTYTFGSNSFEFKMGGVYTVLAYLGDNKIEKATYYEVTKPNDLHLLVTIPQYIIITIGEIFFSITGYEFSYSQAPVSMKSVVQACFLLTSAFGNLIIVIVESAKPFNKESTDTFFYTALMVLDMIILAFIATRYKYVEKKGDDDKNDTSERKSSNKPEESTKF